jgi:oxygen-independent coproporphyrinogen-3 oxidase
MGAIDISRFFANTGKSAIGKAFESRRVVLPWHGRRAIDEGELPEIWSRLMSSHGSSPKQLAYIHVLFCANHCLFCAFQCGNGIMPFELRSVPELGSPTIQPTSC